MSQNFDTNKNIKYKAKIIKGKQIGRTLGFPTINLDNSDLLKFKKKGVYACLVKLKNRIYEGILYYGPRLILGEKNNIIEIYLFDFEKDLYDHQITFILKDFIRGVKNFSDLALFKKQLEADCRKAKNILLK